MSVSDVEDRTETLGDHALDERPPPSFARGEVLGGRYQILGVLGSGGSASVWRAVDRVTSSEIALKLLTTHVRDAAAVERLGRELVVARKLSHPNLCRVFDVEALDGHRFLTLELADRSLRDELRASGTLVTWGSAIKDAASVASGLAALHAAGIVHGDLSAANVLRLPDQRLAIADFGLARLDGALPLAQGGTKPYMAPEREHGPASRASDVWSLGVLLHEMLLGGRPGTAMRSPTLRRTRQSAAFQIAQACLALDPAARPSSADVRERLQALAERRRFKRPTRRTVAAYAGAAAMIIVGALVMRANGARLGFFAPVVASTSAWAAAPVITLGKADPIDLAARGTPITTLAGKLHCFTVLPDGTHARLIWGEPKRAEILDLGTNERTPDSLLPETFVTSCPQLSSDGRNLTWQNRDEHNATQVFVSEDPTGAGGRALVPGTEPQWLPGRSEFIYKASLLHAGIYSLDLMQQRALLANPDPDPRGGLVDIAVSPDGEQVALMFHRSERFATDIVIEPVTSPGSARHVRLDGQTIRAQFAPESHLIAQMFIPGGEVRIASIDLRHAALTAVYRANPADLLRFAGSEVFAGLATKSNHVELLGSDGTVTEKVPFDGIVAWPSVSARGDLITQVWREGQIQVWLKRLSESSAHRATSGGFDTAPVFAPDGESFYFMRASPGEGGKVLRCTLDGACGIILPGPSDMWPTPSPDGRLLAYVTSAGQGAKVRTFDLVSHDARDVAMTRANCPPHWVDANLLRVPTAGEGTDGVWKEVDVRSGQDTGRDGVLTDCDAAAPGDNEGPARMRLVGEWATNLVRLPRSD